MTIGEMIALAAFAGGGLLSTGKILGKLDAMEKKQEKTDAKVDDLAKDVRGIMIQQGAQEATISHVSHVQDKIVTIPGNMPALRIARNGE